MIWWQLAFIKWLILRQYWFFFVTLRAWRDYCTYFHRWCSHCWLWRWVRDWAWKCACTRAAPRWLRLPRCKATTIVTAWREWVAWWWRPSSWHRARWLRATSSISRSAGWPSCLPQGCSLSHIHSFPYMRPAHTSPSGARLRGSTCTICVCLDFESSLTQ